VQRVQEAARHFQRQKAAKLASLSLSAHYIHGVPMCPSDLYKLGRYADIARTLDLATEHGAWRRQPKFMSEQIGISLYSMQLRWCDQKRRRSHRRHRLIDAGLRQSYQHLDHSSD
jgi:hypothetical protein